MGEHSWEHGFREATCRLCGLRFTPDNPTKPYYWPDGRNTYRAGPCPGEALIDCPDCDGRGCYEIVVAGCCGNALPTGECCGVAVPFPDQVACGTCGGRGQLTAPPPSPPVITRN